MCRVGTNTFSGSIIRSNLAGCRISAMEVGVYQLSFSLNGQDFISVNIPFEIFSLTKVEYVTPSTLFEQNVRERIDILVSGDPKLWDVIDTEKITASLNLTQFACGAFRVNSSHVLFSVEVANLVPGEYIVSLRGRSVGSVSLVKDVRLQVQALPQLESIVPEVISSVSSNLLTLRGSFPNFSSLSCSFALAHKPKHNEEIVKIPVFANSSMIVCEFLLSSVSAVVNSFKPRHVYVGLSLNSNTIYLGTVSLIVISEIRGISPTIAIPGERSTIFIEGYFDEFSTISLCRIGTQMFNGTLLNDTIIKCPFIAPEVGKYVVSVSIDGFKFVTSPESLTVLSSPIIQRNQVHRFCPMNSGIGFIKVIGTGFSPFFSQLSCLSGSILENPYTVNDEFILCPCPNYKEPMYSVFNSTQAVTFELLIGTESSSLISSDVQFYDFENLTVVEKVVYRQRTNILTINFESRGLSDKQEIFCRLRSTSGVSLRKVATSISSSSILCSISPNDLDDPANTLLVDISVDNEYFVDVGEVQVLSVPVLKSAYPQFGSELGGFVVDLTVFGVIPDYGVSCLFGGNEVSANVTVDYNSNLVSCVVPSMHPGKYSISVKVDNLVLNSIAYEVIGNIVISKAQPSKLFRNQMGDISFSFTEIPNVALNSSFSCRLSHLEFLSLSSSFNLEDRSVSCSLADLDLDLGEYEVLVYFERSFIGSHVVEIMPIPTISSVTPRNARVETTAVVVLTVESLPPSIPVLCRVGSISFSASRIDQRHVVCPVTASLVPEQVMLSLEVGEYARAEGSVSFIFYSAVKLETIFPSFGSVNGKTAVTVTGHQFQPHLPYNCVFGVVSVVAHYISSTQLSCFTPVSEPLSVSFSLSVDGYVASLSNSAIDFTYFPDPVIYSTYPTSASIYGMFFYFRVGNL
jgi:hypothetical protein